MADELNKDTLDDEVIIIGGELSGEIPEEGQLSGVVTENKDISGTMISRGTISGKNATEGAARATLSVKLGIDGVDGKDGFSPTITVHKDTKTEYILKITNKDGSYLTPNLYPDLEGLQDVEALVASKVDEDLKEYPEYNPVNLSIKQREGTYLYTNSLGVNSKIPLSSIALEEETNEKIRTKLQTVEEVPHQEKWRVGDYIWLDHIPEDNIEG